MRAVVEWFDVVLHCVLVLCNGWLPYLMCVVLCNGLLSCCIVCGVVKRFKVVLQYLCGCVMVCNCCDMCCWCCCDVLMLW